MATTRICYKNAQGQVVCYDGGSLLAMKAADSTAAAADTATTGAAQAGDNRPAKGAAIAQLVRLLNDALAASGNRQMEDRPEYISLEYYAD